MLNSELSEYEVSKVCDLVACSYPVKYWCMTHQNSCCNICANERHSGCSLIDRSDSKAIIERFRAVEKRLGDLGDEGETYEIGKVYSDFSKELSGFKDRFDVIFSALKTAHDNYDLAKMAKAVKEISEFTSELEKSKCKRVIADQYYYLNHKLDGPGPTEKDLVVTKEANLTMEFSNKADMQAKREKELEIAQTNRAISNLEEKVIEPMKQETDKKVAEIQKQIDDQIVLTQKEKEKVGHLTTEVDILKAKLKESNESRDSHKKKYKEETKKQSEQSKEKSKQLISNSLVSCAPEKANII